MTSRKLKVYGDLSILASSDTGLFGSGTLFTSGNFVIKQPTGYDQDSAIFTPLYQDENDVGDGEIIAIRPVAEEGALQSPSTLDTDQVKLSSSSSTTAGFYINYYIKMTSGPYNNYVRRITSYTGGFNKVAEIQTDWSPIIISGTINTTSGSPIVTGSGTSFTTYFGIGSMIHVIDGYYEVLTVDSNTQITLTTNYPSNNSGSCTCVMPRVGDTYILNNERYAVLEFEKDTLSFKFGFTNSDPTTNDLNITKLGKIQVDDIETTKLNGNPIDLSATEIVELPDDSSTGVEITNSATRGTFVVIVESITSGGSCGIFHCSKNDPSNIGIVNAFSVDQSITDEVVDVMFSANEKLMLYHLITKTSGDGSLIQYRVKTDKVSISS
jgi:hypothetical protein